MFPVSNPSLKTNVRGPDCGVAFTSLLFALSPAAFVAVTT